MNVSIVPLVSLTYRTDGKTECVVSEDSFRTPTPKANPEAFSEGLLRIVHRPFPGSSKIFWKGIIFGSGLHGD
jgi:hypothetical protein